MSKKQHCWFADVTFDGETITAKVPGFLGSKLKPGNSVVILHHDQYKVAEVVSTDTVRSHTVRAVIVDRFKLKRFESWQQAAAKTRNAIVAMDKRLGQIEADEKRKAAAEGDTVLAELYAEYGSAAMEFVD